MISGAIGARLASFADGFRMFSLYFLDNFYKILYTDDTRDMIAVRYCFH